MSPRSETDKKAFHVQEGLRIRTQETRRTVGTETEGARTGGILSTTTLVLVRVSGPTLVRASHPDLAIGRDYRTHGHLAFVHAREYVCSCQTHRTRGRILEWGLQE